MKISVVGTGYVGLVAAVCFAEVGHSVISIDTDADKIRQLQSGQATIHELHLPELLRRHLRSRLQFTGNLWKGIREAELIFIAVGTPSGENGEADLSYVAQVSRDIAANLYGHTIIVEKSTVPVCTHAWISKIISLNCRNGFAVEVASNPEFLREGTAVTDFLYPDRIVIGAGSRRTAEALKAVYEPLLDGSYAASPNAIPAPEGARIPAPIVSTDPQSAELIKHASNAFLATKISFINAVANLCEMAGADVEQVRRGMGLDSRIGEAFLKPGIGYGGSCFPKDLAAFRAVARYLGYDFRLLEEVAAINQEQVQRFLHKTRAALWTVKHKRLAALGLAFKGGTDDVRESPALKIIEALLQEGALVVAYDPAASPPLKYLDSGLTLADGPYTAATGADALLILTDWAEFAQLDLQRICSVMRSPVIVDGRNLYDPVEVARCGIRYYSLGRSSLAIPAAAR